MAVMNRRRAEVRMADVSAKPPTLRRAVARCELALKPRTLATIKAGKVPKGDVWSTAQVAGILASKRTAELIPLCHPIPISHVALRSALDGRRLVIEAEVTTTAPTGPEMEALTAAAIAALTVYDMCKVIERGIVIRRLYLVSKLGGKSGTWSNRVESSELRIRNS
ncbi:MAG: cyclic pyranopterin monophosphate synthase MoaC [Candidatus Omnitrophica bacterium]|nr:cyclic pyranopterin monophosphate synthase MoaC [Candidatus Omnitrophota bacterium]MBI2496108.1 cyclic pyranopterin monophosphate synthase MoaC [Candidatus Omnitrophota bacterium]MBI3021344.1 cyclic pyranopterin monophosphate synthase MoaC [Candidatus Omnitrophota bacterium]MBI3083884.1 cyclic pyranopterin monophosphate synthase MoaC [Candidatus Omnitrophota bacterium]